MYEGSRIILSCVVTKGSHLSYTWLFKRKEVKSSNSSFFNLAGNKLLIQQATPDHAGRYSCIAWSRVQDVNRFSSSTEVQVMVKGKVYACSRLSWPLWRRIIFNHATHAALHFHHNGNYLKHQLGGKVFKIIWSQIAANWRHSLERLLCIVFRMLTYWTMTIQLLNQHASGLNWIYWHLVILNKEGAPLNKKRIMLKQETGKPPPYMISTQLKAHDSLRSKF